MVGEFLLDIYIHLQRSSPESTNSMGFFNLAACGLPEEQKNGKANEQFKEVAIETVTRRFQWICWKIRPMATRWRLKKKQWSEHFEGQHKQKWPDMCNLFDWQHLKSDDQDVGGTQNEDNIHVYNACLFESLLFSYPNVLRDICVVHAVLQLQQSYPNKKKQHKNQCIWCTIGAWGLTIWSS